MQTERSARPWAQSADFRIPGRPPSARLRLGDYEIDANDVDSRVPVNVHHCRDECGARRCYGHHCRHAACGHYGSGVYLGGCWRATGNTVAGTGNINNTVTLPVGGSITYTLTGTTGSAATGLLSNTATITATGTTTDANTQNNTVTVDSTLTPQADLQITKTNGVSSVVAGSQTSYVIVVSNAGPTRSPVRQSPIRFRRISPV